MGSPLGPLLALLAALYEPDVAAVAVRGGLVSYLSLLEAPFVYVPFDISVPEILRTGDVPDIMAALAPMPLLGEGLIDGRNFVLPSEKLASITKVVRRTYAQAKAPDHLNLGSTVREFRLTSWLIQQLGAGPPAQ
jgi:hypothetical protein